MSRRKVRARPEDFMQYSLGDMFVGYEAHARLSELYKDGYVIARYRKEVDPTFKPVTRWQFLMKVYLITDKGIDEVNPK